MGYWLVDNDERFNDIDDLCGYLFDPSRYEDDDAVNEYINDSCEGIDIGGVHFDPADIVYELDHSLWCQFESDWQEWCSDNDRDEWYGTLDSMEDGDTEFVNGFTIEFIDEENEEAEQAPAKEEKEVDEEEEIIIKTLMDHFQFIK